MKITVFKISTFSRNIHFWLKSKLISWNHFKSWILESKSTVFVQKWSYHLWFAPSKSPQFWPPQRTGIWFIEPDIYGRFEAILDQKWPIFGSKMIVFFNIPKLAHFFVLSFSFFNTYLWESLFCNFNAILFLLMQLSSNFQIAIWNFLHQMNFLIKIFNKLRWCVCVSIEEKESSIEVGFYAQARHLLHPFFSPPSLHHQQHRLTPPTFC